MTQMNLSMKQKQTHRYKEETVVAKRKGELETEQTGILWLADVNYYIEKE